tara:strand:- start:138 stop:557 length:420 start_codon:yes stop_codon:yes gene_type:complete
MILKVSKKKPSNISESVNVIPMINLIFLLLIFFLLTGVIQKKEKENITIPESFYGLKKDESLKLTFNLISINSKGEILLNDQKILFSELVKYRFEIDSKILMNVDENAKIKKLNEIFKLFKDKGIKNILLNVRHKNVES